MIQESVLVKYELSFVSILSRCAPPPPKGLPRSGPSSVLHHSPMQREFLPLRVSAMHPPPPNAVPYPRSRTYTFSPLTFLHCSEALKGFSVIMEKTMGRFSFSYTRWQHIKYSSVCLVRLSGGIIRGAELFTFKYACVHGSRVIRKPGLALL